jgi:hypothetical protein
MEVDYIGTFQLNPTWHGMEMSIMGRTTPEIWRGFPILHFPGTENNWKVSATGRPDNRSIDPIDLKDKVHGRKPVTERYEKERIVSKKGDI